MRYWLLKSEPNIWGWNHQVARGEKGEEWAGVRNYQARNFMRNMALGDRIFSNIHKIKSNCRCGRSNRPSASQ